MDITDTISLTELLWTMGSVLAFLMRTWLLIDTLKDRATQEGLFTDGALKTIATINTNGDAVLMVIKLGFAVVGVAAMTSPPGTGNDAWRGLLVSGVVLVLVALMVVHSFTDAYLRRKLAVQMRTYQGIDYHHVGATESNAEATDEAQVTTPTPIGAEATTEQGDTDDHAAYD